MFPNGQGGTGRPNGYSHEASKSALALFVVQRRVAAATDAAPVSARWPAAELGPARGSFLLVVPAPAGVSTIAVLPGLVACFPGGGSLSATGSAGRGDDFPFAILATQGLGYA